MIVQRQPVSRMAVRLASSEMKYFDSLRSAATVSESTDWTGTEIDPTTVNTLFAPTEGAAINQRIGRKVHVYKIKIRGVISPGVDMDQTDQLVQQSWRLILFQDMQTNGSQAQGEQLMTPPSTATTALAFSAFQNINNFGRFRVLKDKIIYGRDRTAGTDGANTTSQASALVPFKCSYNFKKPVQTTFNATNGGTIADIVDNSYHLLLQASGSPGSATVSYICRVCFKE